MSLNIPLYPSKTCKEQFVKEVSKVEKILNDEGREKLNNVTFFIIAEPTAFYSILPGIAGSFPQDLQNIYRLLQMAIKTNAAFTFDAVVDKEKNSLERFYIFVPNMQLFEKCIEGVKISILKVFKELDIVSKNLTDDELIEIVNE